MFNHVIRKLRSSLTELSRSIWGELDWKPPYWVRFFTRRYQAHPLRGLIFIVVLVALVAGLFFWTHLPKPVFDRVTVFAPPPSPVVKDARPQPLRLHYPRAVAPIDRTSEASGFQIAPAIPGQWRWTSDADLIFTPTNDWNANTRYTIKLPPLKLRLASDQLEFTTADLVVRIVEAKFYQDPLVPDRRAIVATIETNYPVNRDRLASSVETTAVSGRELFLPNSAPEMTESMNGRRFFYRSALIQLPDQQDYARLTIRRGLPSLAGAGSLRSDTTGNVTVPDRYSFLKIAQISSSIARRPNGDADQILRIQTSTDVRSADLAKAVRTWRLPDRFDAAGGRHEKWPSAAAVPEEVLNQATPVRLALCASGQEFAREHLFRLVEPREFDVLIEVPKDLPGVGGYLLSERYRQIVHLAGLPKEIRIQGEGAMMSLSGEKTLSIVSRGVELIELSLDRVRPGQINHLVSQTSGKFSALEFRNEAFDETNIAELKKASIPVKDPGDGSAQFSSFSLAPFLGQGHGLFFLNTRALDPADQTKVESKNDHRFLLVTDLGMISKRNQDASRENFVVSLRNQTPVEHAGVRVLAKNGRTLFEGETDAAGRLHSPALDESVPENRPVAIICQLQEDLSFLPYDREEMLVDYSRFDTAGDNPSQPGEIQVFPFTDRGVYRPGENVHVGLVVKSDRSGSEKLPLTLKLSDAGENLVEEKTIQVGSFAEAAFELADTAGTGEYHLTIDTPSKKRDSKQDGENEDESDAPETTQVADYYFQVQDFQPDRMKLDLTNVENGKAWLKPGDVLIKAHLENLFGTPASGNLVKATQRIEAGEFVLKGWNDYRFVDPGTRPEDVTLGEVEPLPDQRTDENGNAEIRPELDKYSQAAYRVAVNLSGFEADGGRSVHRSLALLVADLDYVIGYRAQQKLDFLDYDQPARIDLVAVNQDEQPVETNQLQLRILEKRSDPVLTKQEDGTFKYENVVHEVEVRNEPIKLDASVRPFDLPTTRAGKFKLTITDLRQRKNIFTLDYSVVGTNARELITSQGKSLDLEISRPEYQPGETLRFKLESPYDGYGLITVEREKVLSSKWFKTAAGSSVQTIDLPKDLEGYAYVNVSLARTLDSADIYRSPFSSAVAGFRVKRSNAELKLQLNVAKRVKPGEDLAIRYSADRPCKMVIYAVDRGILQVSDYQLPSPLDWVYRKRRLLVDSYQAISDLLPEFSKLRRKAAPGGGDEHVAKNLNPFTRVTEKPVVFWSGILTADAKPRQTIYRVPEYFDGQLDIMAVASGDDAVAARKEETIVRGPLVIVPQVPLFAVPGDEFAATATVTATADSKVATEIRMEVDGGLRALEDRPQLISLEPGKSQTLVRRVRVEEKLGNASVRFVARTGTDIVQRQKTMSVRPRLVYTNMVTTGVLGSGEKTIDLPSDMYPEKLSRYLAVGTSPVSFVTGASKYLEAYPFDCTEQLTSKVYASLYLAKQAGRSSQRRTIPSLELYFKKIKERQSSEGGFGYWTADETDRNLTNYVLMFLNDAKASNVEVPVDLDESGVNYLRRTAQLNPGSVQESLSIAKSIYLLTQRDQVVTNELLNLRETLARSFPGRWEASLTGVYLAASAKTLLKDREAEQWIGNYHLHRNGSGYGLESDLQADAEYVAILAKHFPDRLRSLQKDEIAQAFAALATGDYSTVSAALSMRAILSAQNQFAKETAPRVTEFVNGWKPVPVQGFGWSTISSDAVRVRVQATAAAHYQMIQNGFPRRLDPVSDGLEIHRDWLNADGKPARDYRIGEEKIIRIRVRSTGASPISDVAIVDLFPAGAEPVRDPNGAVVPTGAPARYADFREDRAVLYLTATPSSQEISYRLRLTVAGKLTAPPVAAYAMYNRQIRAIGAAAQLEVRP